MEFERPPGDPDRRHVNPLLKLALELGPLILFFFVNARGKKIMDAWPALATFQEPIFLATAVFMVAIFIALTASWILTRRLAIMPVVTGIVVLVFGGLTLILHDELFIKIKPTIINLLFGGTLLGGLAFGKSLLGYVFDEAINLAAEGWRKLTWRWGLFFLVLAVINEIVWRNFTTDQWVAFKVWGVMPITIAFTLAQMPLLQKYMIDEEDEAGA